MNTGSFIVQVKADIIYINTLQKMLEQWFFTSNYELESPIPKGKNKKAIGVMEDELSGKIMK